MRSKFVDVVGARRVVVDDVRPRVEVRRSRSLGGGRDRRCSAAQSSLTSPARTLLDLAASEPTTELDPR
jgi:hypothetical protein